MPAKKRKRPPLGDETLDLLAGRFAALSDPARLRILIALMDGERSVGDLVETSALEQSNVSRHLGVLRREGIVARRSEGNRAFYRIEDPSVVRLCEVVCGSLVRRYADGLEGLEDARLWSGADI